MAHALIPPREPGPGEPIRPPMIYIQKPLQWEYKQIDRNLDNEQPLDETDLNALGTDGWELAGILQQQPITYFYFKRQIEK